MFLPVRSVLSVLFPFIFLRRSFFLLFFVSFLSLLFLFLPILSPVLLAGCAFLIQSIHLDPSSTIFSAAPAHHHGRYSRLIHYGQLRTRPPQRSFLITTTPTFLLLKIINGIPFLDNFSISLLSSCKLLFSSFSLRPTNPSIRHIPDYLTAISARSYIHGHTISSHLLFTCDDALRFFIASTENFHFLTISTCRFVQHRHLQLSDSQARYKTAHLS